MLTMAYQAASILVWTMIHSYPMPQEPPNFEKAQALMESTPILSRITPQLLGNSVQEVEIMTLFHRAVLDQPTKLIVAPRSGVGQSPRPRRPTLELNLPRTQPALTQSSINLSRRCLPLGLVLPANQGHPRGRMGKRHQEHLNP